ncbi:TIGR00730 family Rossman fold protein [Fulvimarina sp. MAC8]|uniref:LOG family protein n=1 Tax=Fulvimarina sp. MAC8 TaxID=3162874 RepID=UPI0032EEA291
MTTIRSICVYCGSSAGHDPAFISAARDLGMAIAEAGIRLVYGGGTRGIMGAVSEGVIAGGGKVTGIIPRFLIDMEATDRELKRLDELVVTEDMHERKHLMFQRSDAFVALPGGIGTLEELIEILTWGQLGRHEKPIVIANLNGFWNPLKSLLDHMDSEGFIHRAQHVRPIMTADIASVIPEIEGALDRASSEGRSQIIEKL